MNYYEHHLGDYLRDTAHLSMLEDGAYRRLLDAYYIKEAPLPIATRDVFRLVRAQSKQDREAVETVLREFFTETPDGWKHTRCDKEIARFQDKQRKAKASAEARWAHRQPHSDCNANASPDAMRTHSEGNAPRARPQTPDTRPYVEPEGSTPGRAAKPRPAKKCPADFAVTDEMVAWARAECPGVSISAETPKFRDHTFATAATDWPGRWRNWMRKAAEMAGQGNRGATQASRPRDIFEGNVL